ncbi:MAG TPA: DUF222 domain-containing protein [Propionibacteriaceae bacterium]
MNTPVPSRYPAMTGALTHALADLDAVRAGRVGASDEALLDAIVLIRTLQRRVDGTLSVLLGAAEQRDAAMRLRHTPLESLLTGSGQESPGQVRNQVFQAAVLASRPVVQDAAASGAITLGQAHAIRDVLENLPGTLDDAQKDQAQQLLLAAAERVGADKLRTMTDAILDTVAPDAKDTPEQRQAKLELRDARAGRRRCLRFGVPTDGSIDFRGSLPLIEGTRLKNLVDAIAARDYRAAKDATDRDRLAASPDQRLADALMTVVTAAEQQTSGGSRTDQPGVTPGDQKGSNGQKSVSIPVGGAQISVLIRESELYDRATAAGMLPDGAQLSAGELRRLMCDAGMVPVVLGGSGEILDLGRERRLASPALRHAVGLRDGHCAFPECTVPILRCELHHIIPWQQGGPTSLHNLVALCARHHHLCEPAPPVVDVDGYARAPDQWRIRMSPDGLPEFIAPAALAVEPHSGAAASDTVASGAPASDTVASGASSVGAAVPGTLGAQGRKPATPRGPFALTLFNADQTSAVGARAYG